MARVITINRPEVVDLIETVAARMTGGNKTEAVRLAMTRLLESRERPGSLFGAHSGSVHTAPDVDLTEPVLDVEPDAATGAEVGR
jgi:hypothetical protein